MPAPQPIAPTHHGTPATLRALLPYWPVTAAAFLGWFLDAFDQTVLLFTLPDIASSLGCTLAAMGGVLFVQSLGRAAGNTGWGWLADRHGRKPAFMLGVVWFGVFSALTGLTHSLVTMMVVQFCFGMGFGGEWTASATLLMETVPARLRAMASALMMTGYESGYLLAAGAQALILPHYSWRVLFFIGLAPALLALFVRLGVGESPLWLAERRSTAEAPGPKATSAPPLRWTPLAVQAVLFMVFLEFQKAAIYTFYPTILRQWHHLSPQALFWPVALYCLGSLGGKLGCGWLATRWGEGRIMMGAIIISALMAWPFLCAPNGPLLLASAFIMGTSASGVFALVPHWLAKRFPTRERSFGMGLSYALGSIGQGVAGKVIPLLGRTPATLPLAAIGLVLGGSAAAVLTLTWQPSLLGEDGDASEKATPKVPRSQG
ncbi:MFS transporter [Formicincola oecophyllae]|uniref:MFS transporter n=1 Tax=Formicincola oecophyllae TaxID=2558361 RepID=A0A4Y6U8P9_9PROT|nr:MFS transporter [Formicincola oecophyllae]QDH13742.1 MFS transporter [Formicincola oecophyllae]